MTRRKKPRLVRVELTQRQWEIVHGALGESAAHSRNDIHWKTREALADAASEIAQAAGCII